MIRNAKVGDRVNAPSHMNERRPATIVEVGVWRGRRGATSGTRIVVLFDDDPVKRQFSPRDLERLEAAG